MNLGPSGCKADALLSLSSSYLRVTRSTNPVHLYLQIGLPFPIWGFSAFVGSCPLLANWVVGRNLSPQNSNIAGNKCEVHMSLKSDMGMSVMFGGGDIFFWTKLYDLKVYHRVLLKKQCHAQFH